jgi:hypothetical protein
METTVTAPKGPPPPKGLCAEARSLWADVVNEYALAPWQLHVLATAAGAKHDEVTANTVIRDMGSSYETSTGMIHPRPEVAIRRDARVAFLRACRDLGLEVGD